MNPETDAFAETVARQLRERGLRVTPQRRAIWSVFAALGQGHLSADEVLSVARERYPDLSRATVYNTLNEFTRVGLVRAVEGFGPTLFDPNMDATHHHLRCGRCQRLFDVHVVGDDALRVADPDFLVDGVQIIFVGLCPECHAR
ncbi:MAG: transcriptional repressor [Dehalococcoidia bacterium]|nr:transcriptional repressor [Dehalococcoidia bacterium]